ncbi:helix-turn-helix transcriptional regulator [Chloroflexota bacterium]
MEINRVREYRERAGLSQVELARRARIASPNLSSIERGRLLPWPKVKRALAKALKCAEAELFPDERDASDGE